MNIFFLFLIFSLNFQKPFYLEGFPENCIESKIQNLQKEKLQEKLKEFPNCDFFYIPFLKEKDLNSFKDYFLKAGTEPLLLLYFLRNYEYFQEIFIDLKIDKVELLKRFLWALQIDKERKNCPPEIKIKKPKIMGFQDEIFPSCYNLFLVYSIGEFQDSVHFYFENEFDWEAQREEILKLMQKYKIPILNRNIIQNLPREIKKLKGNN